MYIDIYARTYCICTLIYFPSDIFYHKILPRYTLTTNSSFHNGLPILCGVQHKYFSETVAAREVTSNAIFGKYKMKNNKMWFQHPPPPANEN